MKKLLAVAALLAVGATSFGAVVEEITQAKGHTAATLPVGVRGNLVTPTNLALEVTAVKSAGVNGNRLEFDFADMIKGAGKQTLEGTFKVRLIDDQSAEVAFAAEPMYSLYDGKAAFDAAAAYTTPVKTVTNGVNGTDTAAAVKGVALDYTLAATKGTAGVKSNEGIIAVTADAKDATDNGVFTTSEVQIKVIVQNQDKLGALL